MKSIVGSGLARSHTTTLQGFWVTLRAVNIYIETDCPARHHRRSPQEKRGEESPPTGEASPEFDDYTGLVGIHSVCCSMSTCARRFDLASERAANERREQRQGENSVESSKTGSLKCDIA